MYEIDRNFLPNYYYVMDIFPNTRVNASNYFTRNAQNYSIPKCRLQLYKSSFAPTVLTNGMRFQRMSVKATPFAFSKKNYMFLS